MCVRKARRDFEWSRKFLQVLRATRESSRKIRRKENYPQKGALGPQSSVECSSLHTFEAGYVAQVDAQHVLDVRQVIRQRELAAAPQVDAVRAMLRANVADHANDRAGEVACVEDEK